MRRAAGIRIRRAGPADAGPVTALVARAYAPWIARIGRRPAPMYQDYARIIRAHHSYVAVCGLRRVGLLVLRLRASDALIENVAVDPDFQGAHIGSMLMHHAERTARGLARERMVLYTHARMRDNRTRYRRLGYREAARLNVRGYDRIYMQKRLYPWRP